MNDVDQTQAPNGEPAIPYPWAVVLSVVLVMGCLFFLPPTLLDGVPLAARLPIILLAVPAFPAITGWLQGTMDSRRPNEHGLRALPREYLYHCWSLALELTIRLATLPVIAAQLIGVIAAIMLIVCAIVLLMAGAQHLFGLRISGVTLFSAADIWLVAKVVLGCIAGTLSAFGLAALLEKAFDRSADIAGVLNRRVNAWLRKYL